LLVATTQATQPTQPSPQNEQKVKKSLYECKQGISTKYEKTFIAGVIDTGESVVINFNFQIPP
jgi:hypothetical protein